MSAFFVTQPSDFPIIFQHSHSARFFPHYFVDNQSDSSVSRYIAGSTETIHGDVKRNHQSLCRFVETEHGL